MKVRFGKMFAMFLAAVNIAALSSGFPTASAETADDADLLLEFLTLISDLSDLQLHLSDYNEDGKVSMTDLTALNGALPANEQALLRESVAELYNSLPIEKQIEMNSMFTELQTALSVDLELVTA